MISENIKGKIFKPTRKGLIQAQKRIDEKWAKLREQNFTREQKLERMNLDIEIFEDMKIVRERANLFIDIL